MGGLAELAGGQASDGLELAEVRSRQGGVCILSSDLSYVQS